VQCLTSNTHVIELRRPPFSPLLSSLHFIPLLSAWHAHRALSPSARWALSTSASAQWPLSPPPIGRCHQRPVGAIDFRQRPMAAVTTAHRALSPAPGGRCPLPPAPGGCCHFCQRPEAPPPIHTVYEWIAASGQRPLSLPPAPRSPASHSHSA